MGAAKYMKTKTSAPPETLTKTAPQIQRLKVTYRKGSTGGSAGTRLYAELIRGGVLPADAKDMPVSLAGGRDAA